MQRSRVRRSAKVSAKVSAKKESPESAHVESLKPKIHKLADVSTKPKEKKKRAKSASPKPKIHKLTRVSTKQPESAKKVSPKVSAKKVSPKKDLTDPQLLLLRRIARAEDAGELIQQADQVGLNKVLFVRLFEQLTPR